MLVLKQQLVDEAGVGKGDAPGPPGRFPRLLVDDLSRFSIRELER